MEDQEPKPAPSLAVYECHKRVGAAKIVAVKPSGCDSVPCSLTLEVDDNQFDVTVEAKYITKHEPKVGGYFVCYEDGYLSFSPAAAFESGYERVDMPPMLDPEAVVDEDGEDLPV